MATGGGPTSQVPQSLRSIAPYIRIAAEHETKNPVIAYWCRFYALANGLKVKQNHPLCSSVKEYRHTKYTI